MNLFKVQYKKLISKFYFNININEKYDNSIDLQNKNYNNNDIINTFISNFNIKTKVGLYNLYKKYIPNKTDYFIIRSFPKKDIVNILATECPTPYGGYYINEKSTNINNIGNNENSDVFSYYNKDVINLSKKLRKHFNIQEQKACSNCSKKHYCKFFEKEFNSKLYKYYRDDIENSNKDIKGDNKKHDNSEFNPYEIYLHELNEYLHLLNMTNTYYLDSTNYTNSTDENVNKRYIFSNVINENQYLSAKILTDCLYNLLDDYINHDGIYYKTLHNSILSNKKIDINRENSIILNNKITNKYYLNNSETINNKTKFLYNNKYYSLDEIKDDPRILLSIYKESKNKKDKKILLAKFNAAMKETPVEWGKYEKIDKKAALSNLIKTKNNADTYNNISNDLKVLDKNNYNNNLNKVDKHKSTKDANMYNKTINHKKELSSNLSENTNHKGIKYSNSVVYSKKALERTNISKDNNVTSIVQFDKANKFNKDININNQKVITFNKEKNINTLKSLHQNKINLINNNNGKNIDLNNLVDYSIVNIPGKEVSMALNYIKNNSTKDEIKNNIEEFKQRTKADINRYAINITETINNNKSKIDKKIDDLNSETLDNLELKNNTANINYSNDLIKYNILKNSKINNKVLIGGKDNIKTNIKEIQKSNNELIYIENNNEDTDNYNNAKTDIEISCLSAFERKIKPSEVNISYKDTNTNDDITYLSSNALNNNDNLTLNRSEYQEIEILKQLNPVKTNLIKSSQIKNKIKKEKLNKVNNYKANNFYSNNTDTVQFEKDLDVERSLKHENKVKLYSKIEDKYKI